MFLRRDGIHRFGCIYGPLLPNGQICPPAVQPLRCDKLYATNYYATNYKSRNANREGGIVSEVPRIGSASFPSQSPSGPLIKFGFEVGAVAPLSPKNFEMRAKKSFCALATICARASASRFCRTASSST